MLYLADFFVFYLCKVPNFFKLKYSLIVPVYNRPEEVKELLESIAEQTYTGDFETLIIEDGSSISSQEVVASFADKTKVIFV